MRIRDFDEPSWCLGWILGSVASVKVTGGEGLGVMDKRVTVQTVIAKPLADGWKRHYPMVASCHNAVAGWPKAVAGWPSAVSGPSQNGSQ